MSSCPHIYSILPDQGNFDSWDDYLHGLLTFWLDERCADTFLALDARDADPATSIREISAWASAFRATAVSWASWRKQPDLAARVSEGDEKAVAFIELLLTETGLPPEHARIRVQLLFVDFVGVNHVDDPVGVANNNLTLLEELVLSPPPPTTCMLQTVNDAKTVKAADQLGFQSLPANPPDEGRTGIRRRTPC